MANENIKVISNREDIVAIADNIRTLTGVTGELTLAEMATAKGSGSQGDVNLPELTNPASEDQIFEGYEVIDEKGSKKTGTFTITEEVNTQTDLISQIKTKVNSLPDATEGVDLPELTNPATDDEVFLNQEYIDGSGSKKSGTFTIDTEMTAQNSLINQIKTALDNKASGSVPVLQDKTITPTTNSQTVTADSGYDGLGIVIVNGDENLKPENIVSGKSIFGVNGSASGSSGGGTSGSTFSVINNLAHPLIVNGVECAVGETTAGIPYGDGWITFVILLLDESEDHESLTPYTWNYSTDDYGVAYYDWNFAAYGPYIDSDGDEYDSENCYVAASVIATGGVCNISGTLYQVPWDEVNNIPIDGATLEFIMY